MSLTERPGWLRLRGKQSMGNTFEQALVARRQEHLACTVETCLDFAPDTFQQSAGLVSYYNGHKFHYLLVSVDDEGRRHLDIMSCPADASTDVRYPLREGQLDPTATDPRFLLPDEGPVWLGAEIDGHDLVFRWSPDGATWTDLPITLDQSLISDEAGLGEGASFTGAFLGMVCQDLSGGDRAADFDFFSYRPA
jgi:xylan 1,4-beta-xylosidase